MKISDLSPGSTYIIGKDDYIEICEYAKRISDTVEIVDITNPSRSHKIYRTVQVCRSLHTLKSYGVDISRLNPYILIIDETTQKKHSDLTYYREDISQLEREIKDVNAIFIIVRDANDICDGGYTFLP